MTTQQAISHIKDIICENNTVRHSDMVVFEEEKKALYIARQALEQIQQIKDIIIQHDADRMPEDFWYIDEIREVVNK